MEYDKSEDGSHYSYWKAKVLEVRALDPKHVHLRVARINRPEDLPGGRQPHHTMDELVPSNEMDFFNAKYVKGPVEVMPWSKRPADGTTLNVMRPQYSGGKPTITALSSSSQLQVHLETT